MKRFLAVYYVALTIVIILGCGNAVGNNGDNNGVQSTDGCFYRCSAQIGEFYGCAVDEDITTSSDCDEQAEQACSGETVLDVELVADCTCEESCAPTWYSE